MVAEGSGWIEGMRAAGWGIQRCVDRDAYTVRGPNPEREGDFVVFEVSGPAIAGARTVQELVDHMYNMMRTAVEDAASIVLQRDPYVAMERRPRMVMRPRPGPEPRVRGLVRNIDVNEVMRQQYAPAIEQMLNERVVYDEVAPEQPTLHRQHQNEEMVEAEVKAKLYLKELMGTEQFLIYCDSHLIGLKAGNRGWLIGNISRPREIPDPGWSAEVAMPRSSEIETFCINPIMESWIPFTDSVITLALALLARPNWFYNEANPIDTFAMDHSLNPARFILQ